MDDHTFEFVEGILPVNKPKELSSVADLKDGCLGYFDPDIPSSALTALRQLDDFIESHGPFDGVIAFSQGAQLAATYIVYKTFQKHDSFSCAFLFSPLGIYDPNDWITGSKVRRMDFETDRCPIRVPCLVVWGEKDEWKEEAESMSKLCDPETSYSFVHAGEHEIPGIRLEDDVAPIAKLAKRCIAKAGM